MGTHKVLVSPAQRFQLYMLAHAEQNKIPDGEAGRRYRRFINALGLHNIGVVAREHNAVRPKMAADERTRHLFEVDDNAREYVLKLASKERTAQQEDILGPLFDVLDNIQAGRAYDEPTGTVLDLEADADLWLPDGVRPGKLLSMPPAS